MDGKQAAQVIRTLIEKDLASTSSRIAMFLKGSGRGGWEPWLQVEAALALAEAQNPNVAFIFEREVAYPAAPLKCDLHIKPDPNPPAGKVAGKGADIWIELKTQRTPGYAATVSDLLSDIVKFGNRHASGQSDVFVAAALFVANGNTTKELDGLSKSVPHGTTLNIAKLDKGQWGAVSSSSPTAAGDIVFATWVNVVPV